tara:strand:- start:11815 stop:14187 length:2373 start_codon:yes stop_codon:yes gene_type:complete
MYKNYLKIAFRNLWRHRGFSFLNIAGLAIGLSAGFLILLYVSFELSYDQFHSKADRIYRVVSDIETPTSTIKNSEPAWAVPPHLHTAFEEVESAVRIQETRLLVHRDGKRYNENNGLAVDLDFFKMFDFKLLSGNKENALVAPFSIVLSESMAKKYFGDLDPIGESLDIEDYGFVGNVTAVMEDMPVNSHLRADILISLTTFFTENYSPNLNDNWEGYEPDAYILLKPKVNAKVLESKFPEFLERNDGEGMKKLQAYVTLYLEPFKEVYLRSDRYRTISGNINNVYTLSIVALFILLIASINFINLTTARSTERAREVGIRKVIGAEKRQLGLQFIGESTLICLLAFSLTLAITSLILPAFNDMAGKTIAEGILSNPSHVLSILGIAILIGILAGSYPAFILSSFKPVNVLKGSFSNGTKGILLRKGLVVTQFSISIALIIGTIVIYHQMSFMRNQDLGFDKERMVILNSSNTELKDGLEALPGVVSTSLVSSIPGGDNPLAYSRIQNVNNDQQIVDVDAYFVDFDAITQFDMKVVAGRGFSSQFPTDTLEAMVINESAVKLLGFASPKDALEAKFEQWGRSGRVVGVVQDFHFKSLKENIDPLTMRVDRGRKGLLTVKLSSNDLTNTVASIEEKWKAVLPNEPFDYYFLDEFFDRQYRADERFGYLIFNFSMLAIIISCLGLFGLVAYSTVQRRREIGIRKVIGASVMGIVKLLSKEFLKLVGLAIIVASPLAWLVMNYWLEDFAYQIEIQWWVFVMAGTMVLTIALLTVGFHAIKAANINPVKSLRTE